MIKFLEYNIKDPNIIGLIKKYLKAGIMDKGKYVATEEGSAQGNIISPVLANIYMHFVLVLWYKEIVQKRAKGDTFLVVYADDFITGFQYKYEAEAYYEALKNRMSKFGLELEESKSRLLEFGRYAEGNRKARGERKPETFDFLGFTFYCSKSRSDLMEQVKIKLIGHYRYYGISHNGRMISCFRQRTIDFLYKILNRRSHKKSYTVEGFKEMLKVYKLPYPKIYISLFDWK